LRSHVRVIFTRQFCNILERRVDASPVDSRDQPSIRRLVIVGYALVVCETMAGYSGDNILMLLIEHVCQFLGLEYKWKSIITSFAINNDEAEFAEILISGLAQAYVDTGFGVAVQQAGLSCRSAKFIGQAHEKVMELWQDTKAFRWRATPFVRNRKREMAKSEDSKKEQQVTRSRNTEQIEKAQVEFRKVFPSA
jgi:hypothetical protein